MLKTAVRQQGQHQHGCTRENDKWTSIHIYILTVNTLVVHILYMLCLHGLCSRGVMGRLHFPEEGVDAKHWICMLMTLLTLLVILLTHRNSTIFVWASAIRFFVGGVPIRNKRKTTVEPKAQMTQMFAGMTPWNQLTCRQPGTWQTM